MLYWKITEKTSRLVLINVLSIPLFAACLGMFFWLAVSIGRLPDSFGINSPANFLPWLAGLVLLPVLHELVHGISMRSFGARPRYGFLWKALAFYATAPGFAFPRRRYLVVALSPLVVLSLLAVLLMALLPGTPWIGLIAFIAALNATGAIGDLWITGLVLRYPKDAYIVDERDGVRIFLPGEEAPAVSPG